VPVALPAAAASLGSGDQLVLVHTPRHALSPGDVWTCTVDSDGYGGRVVPERYPIEAWPHSSECALPGANDANAADVADKFGVDSLYYEGSAFQKTCGHSLTHIVNALPASSYIVTDRETAAALNATGSSHVDAVLCGDEVEWVCGNPTRDSRGSGFC
jgi:hypothetical protein